MYKVVVRFMDLQDDNYVYNVGDTFPREGKEVSLARLTELSTTENKRGVVLIEESKEKVLVEESETKEKPKATAKGGRKKATK